MRRAISIGLALMGTSCAPLSAGKHIFPQATPLCIFLEDEQRYAARQVMVSALLRQTPHGRMIHDSRCNGSAQLRGSSEFWERNARLVVEAALANDGRAAVPVVVSGVFQPWVRYGRGLPVINGGGPFIEDGRIVAARQP